MPKAAPSDDRKIDVATDSGGSDPRVIITVDEGGGNTEVRIALREFEVEELQAELNMALARLGL